jgi:hypothetical protein
MKQSCHDGVLKSEVAALGVAYSGRILSLVCLHQLKGSLPGFHASKYTFAPYFSQEIIRAGHTLRHAGNRHVCFLLYELPGDEEYLRLAVFSQ